MKAKLDAILQREQAEYLDRLLLPSDALLAEMEQYAAQHRVPIADREVALFLEITARVIGAKRALECGMAIGYSVIHLLRGMPDDGQVVTIDPSDEMITAAEGYLTRAGLRARAQNQEGLRSGSHSPTERNVRPGVHRRGERRVPGLSRFESAEIALRRRGRLRQPSVGRASCRTDSFRRSDNIYGSTARLQPLLRQSSAVARRGLAGG